MSTIERPEVVVARCIPIFPDSAEFLVVRRSLLGKRRTYHGRWELPGGRAEDGEELEDALRREIPEETGYQVECRSDFVKVADRKMDREYDGWRYKLYCCVADVVGGGLQVDGIEHTEALRTNLSDALVIPDLTAESRRALKKLGKYIIAR